LHIITAEGALGKRSRPLVVVDLDRLLCNFRFFIGWDNQQADPAAVAVVAAGSAEAAYAALAVQQGLDLSSGHVMVAHRVKDDDGIDVAAALRPVCPACAQPAC
jgi:hypothetical protein